jgi:hypothetical protein
MLQEAWILLGLARLMSKLFKFNRYARVLGKQLPREPEAPSAEQFARAKAVAGAVRTMSARTPWKSRCLPQAIATQIMLGRRRINSTLFLGLTRNDEKRMKAHAWVMCGATTLIGERPWDIYTPVAAFSKEFGPPAQCAQEEAKP